MGVGRMSPVMPKWVKLCCLKIMGMLSCLHMNFRPAKLFKTYGLYEKHGTKKIMELCNHHLPLTVQMAKFA